MITAYLQCFLAMVTNGDCDLSGVSYCNKIPTFKQLYCLLASTLSQKVVYFCEGTGADRLQYWTEIIKEIIHRLIAIELIDKLAWLIVVHAYSF